MSADEQRDSGRATTDDSGKLRVDIEDAGGRELRDVDEKPPDDEIEEMDEERERRLDPENRPDGAEVDNTQRTFDPETGLFTDNEESEAPYAGSDEEGEG